MANREVNLTKRIQTMQGWRYCPVALSANGRVKPDVVLINGEEEKHPEGAYYLEWREGAKRVRLSVGKDPPGCGCAATAQGSRTQRAQPRCSRHPITIEQRPSGTVGCNPRMVGRNQADEETKKTMLPTPRALNISQSLVTSNTWKISNVVIC